MYKLLYKQFEDSESLSRGDITGDDRETTTMSAMDLQSEENEEPLELKRGTSNLVLHL